MLSACLSVCPPLLVTFEPAGRFHEIRQGGHAIEVYLDAIFSNPVASATGKWRAFKLLM
jgi:hypothetical protein